MRYRITIWLMIVHSVAFSQDWKPARISEKDGYALLREGQGKEFAVVDSIKADEYFYCKSSDSEWWAVQHAYHGRLSGYIHKSRICLLESLPLKEMQNVIMTVFIKQEELAKEFVKSLAKIDKKTNNWKTEKDSVSNIESGRIKEIHSETHYNPILDILPLYYCRTKDTSVIIQLYKTLWTDGGSANEAPAWALGYCFVCEPELTSLSLKSLPNEIKEKAKGMIAFGLNNVCKTREEEMKLNEILDTN